MNNYFQFKQFKIQQDKCAMKVCTDACLFGAWVANKLATENTKPNNILDIGSGTGLLSLMLAQKIKSNIETIEIDKDAFLQSKENIEVSIFKDQITPHFGDVKHTNFNTKFDCIISNPPFFENQLKSNNTERNTAMHATTLSFDDLVDSINKNISTEGVAYILLPHYAVENFEKIVVTKKLFVKQMVQIKHSPTHPFFRTILCVGKRNITNKQTEITIKNNKDNYSKDFTELLKEYYLYL
jgi:tRNA1Val (adenine37-N6)-methyltransferase